MNTFLWYICLAIYLVLDSLFPIFSYFALQTMPTLWLFVTAVFISMCCGIVIMLQDKIYIQYRKREILLPTFLSAVFLWAAGLLYFFGIKYSSPSIASILLLLQTFFAFIVFNIFWKEDYHIKQLIWAGLMFIWWVIILYDWSGFVSFWALIMVFAGILFTIWNYFTKKASHKWASPFFLLLNRNILMVCITTVLALTFVWPLDFSLVELNITWIFFIGFLVLFIWKALWIQALANLNSFVAISTLPIIPLLVMIFSYFILQEIPSGREVLWFIPIGLGTILLTSKK